MSRQSGEEFEYVIARYLKETYRYEFFDKYSENKYKKWTSVFEYNEPDFPFIDEFADYDKIKFCKDTEGCIGNSSDIELHNDKEWVPLSLKNNNLSIKHPRCSSIHNHISKQNKKKYIDGYKKINDHYYKLAIDNGFTKFNEFDDRDKTQMYMDFKKLLMDICKQSISTCKSLFEFCIGITHTHQIIVKRVGDNIICMRYKPITLDKICIRNVSYNTFILSISDISLKFRIHSASSRVTNILSLKYDVTPVDVNELFDVIENDI